MATMRYGQMADFALYQVASCSETRRIIPAQTCWRSAAAGWIYNNFSIITFLCVRMG